MGAEVLSGEPAPGRPGTLQDKIMFGSDYPSIPYARLFREWDELGLPVLGL